MSSVRGRLLRGFPASRQERVAASPVAVPNTLSHFVPLSSQMPPSASFAITRESKGGASAGGKRRGARSRTGSGSASAAAVGAAGASRAAVTSSTSVAEWIYNAHAIFAHMEGRGAAAAAAGPSAELVAGHLRELTRVVRVALPSPHRGVVCQPADDRSSVGGRRATGQRTAQSGGNGDADDGSAAGGCCHLIVPRQRSIVSAVLAHVQLLRECTSGAGQRAWPQREEVALVTALIASLPVAQRESLGSFAVLVALAAAAGVDAAGGDGVEPQALFDVAAALETALREQNNDGGDSCLPWLLYRASLSSRHPPPDESGSGMSGQAIASAAGRALQRGDTHQCRRRWLELATRQLCAAPLEELCPAETAAVHSPPPSTAEDDDREALSSGGVADPSSLSSFITEDTPAFLRDQIRILGLDLPAQQPQTVEGSGCGAVPLATAQQQQHHPCPPSSTFPSSSCVAGDADAWDCWSSSYVTPAAASLLGEMSRRIDPRCTPHSCFAPYYGLTLTEMLSSAFESLEALSAPLPSPAQGRGGARDGGKRGQAPRGDAHATVQQDEGFHAVGVYQAMRRFMAAMGKHDRLRPLLELHQRVTGGSNSIGSTAGAWRRAVLLEGDGALSDTTPRRLQQPSGLLWRELALLEAFALISVGHVGERASDFESLLLPLPLGGSSGDGGPSLTVQVRWMQSACLRRLRDLGETIRDDNDDGDGSRDSAERVAKERLLQLLTPRTRADLVARLNEALRLSAKVHLRVGDMAAIRALYLRHDSIGGSWEVGRALHAAGDCEAAVRAFTRFFADTRQQFPTELPQAIRDVAIAAVRGLGSEQLAATNPCHASAATTTSAAAAGEAADRGGAVSRLLDCYGRLREWHVTLPPAVCADALLSGLLLGPTTSCGAAGERLPSPHAAAAAAPAAAAVEVATAFLRGVMASPAYAQDGLTSHTVEVYVDALLARDAARQVQEEGDSTPAGSRRAAAATSAITAEEEEEAVGWALLVQLMHQHPHVPIFRIAVTRCLLKNHRVGTATLLRGVLLPVLHASSPVPPPAALQGLDENAAHTTTFSEAFLRATLQAFPLAALEDLLSVCGEETFWRTEVHFTPPLDGLRPRGSDGSDGDDSSTAHVGVFLPRSVQLRLIVLVDAALQHRALERDAQQQPWQCLLCRTWNGRFATACKLCNATSTALVQCAACGGYGSSNDDSCSLCGAVFALGTSGGGSKVGDDDDGSIPGAAGFGVRAADAVLDAPCFRAVHPLRPWSCTGCRHRNDAANAFYCGGCGAVRPEMAGALRDGAYSCPGCHQHNPVGALRPWCRACGLLSPHLPQEQQQQQQRTLWLCLECHRLNPWLLARCDACGAAAARPPSPRVSVPWRVRTCGSCQAVNPLAASHCRRCSAALVDAVGDAEGEKAPPGVPADVWVAAWRQMDAWQRSNVVHTVGGVSGAAVTGSRADSIDARNTAAAAPSPPLTTTSAATAEERALETELWVCLRDGCLQVNTSSPLATAAAAVSASETACSRCGQVKSERVAYLWRDALPHDTRALGRARDPLAGRRQGESVLLSDNLSGKPSLSSSSSAIGAVVLVPPQAAGDSARCAQCATPQEPINIIGFCHTCGHCDFLSSSRKGGEASAAFTSLQYRLLLQTLHEVARRYAAPADCCAANSSSGHGPDMRVEEGPCCHGGGCDCVSGGPTQPDWRLLVGLLASVVPKLREAAEAHAPWQGCDPRHGMRCCPDPRAAVLLVPAQGGTRATTTSGGDATAEGVTVDAGVAGEGEEEEEVLHSALETARVTVQDLCACAARVAALPPTCGTAGTSDATLLSQQCRQLCLLTALEVVDFVSRSTDCDEIGFPTLARLCELIRPGEAAHIHSETRWAYLREMKLSREWIVHGAACPWCLGTHGKGQPCEWVCADRSNPHGVVD